MVWILISEEANQLTCNICPYVYYDERTEWYKCERTKRPVHTCVYDNKRSDECPIQATDTPLVPAADVVEVIRCRDCIHYSRDSIYPNGFCEAWEGYVRMDDYCSDGQREDGGQDA